MGIEDEGNLKGPTVFLQNLLLNLANIINNDISSNKYSKHDKAATVRPIFKKDDRTNIKKLSPSKSFKYFFENIGTISA